MARPLLPLFFSFLLGGSGFSVTWCHISTCWNFIETTPGWKLLRLVDLIYRTFSGRLATFREIFQVGWPDIQKLFKLVGQIYRNYSSWLARFTEIFQVGWPDLQKFFPRRCCSPYLLLKLFDLAPVLLALAPGKHEAPEDYRAQHLVPLQQCHRLCWD